MKQYMKERRIYMKVGRYKCVVGKELQKGYQKRSVAIITRYTQCRSSAERADIHPFHQPLRDAVRMILVPTIQGCNHLVFLEQTTQTDAAYLLLLLLRRRRACAAAPPGFQPRYSHLIEPFTVQPTYHLRTNFPDQVGRVVWAHQILQFLLNLAAKF